MKNKEILDYISNNINNISEFISEECTANGYGQNAGGYYLDAIKDKKRNQQKHFIHYYSKFPDKYPSYSYLRCPQLLLFIAEAFGLNKDYITTAFDQLKKFEYENKLQYTQKNGNYIFEKNKDVLKEIKITLKISKLTRILKNAQSIDDAKIQIKKL